MAKKTKRPIKTIEIEGVDEPIHIKQLNAKHFAECADLLKDAAALQSDPVKAADGMAWVCFRSIVDEEGKPVYDDPDEVLEETFAFLEQCTEAALEINGLAEDDPEADVKN